MEQIICPPQSLLSDESLKKGIQDAIAKLPTAKIQDAQLNDDKFDLILQKILEAVDRFNSIVKISFPDGTDRTLVVLHGIPYLILVKLKQAGEKECHAAINLFTLKSFAMLISKDRNKEGELDEEFKERKKEFVMNEFRILRHPIAFKCPNIVHCEDAEIIDDRAYMVQDLYDGALGHFLEESGYTLTPVERLRIAIQQATSVQAVHEMGLIHHDIKTANFLIRRLSGGYQIALCDFGLSLTQEELAERVSKVGGGTDYYTPPELAKIMLRLPKGPERLKALARVITPSIDVFSLASVFYTLFSNNGQRVPWRHLQDKDQILYAITQLKGDWLKHSFFGVPIPGIIPLMSSMFELDPAKRPPIDQIVERLKQMERETFFRGFF